MAKHHLLQQISKSTYKIVQLKNTLLYLFPHDSWWKSHQLFVPRKKPTSWSRIKIATNFNCLLAFVLCAQGNPPAHTCDHGWAERSSVRESERWMSWFRDRETFLFCVVGTEEDRAEDHHPCPHLAFSPPVLFHSSKHSISEHCVISPWIITFGGCRQRYRTENKTAGGAAGAEEHGSSQHKLICTLERNYSHLGVVLKPANSIHNFRAVPILLVSTSRDERKLATNIWSLL